jgi:IstB-like ATP binding protein
VCRSHDCNQCALSGICGLALNSWPKGVSSYRLSHVGSTSGHAMLFTSAGQLLRGTRHSRQRFRLRSRLRHYARPDLLVDKVGNLFCSNRHADLLFQLVNRGYENKSIMLTTKRKCGAGHFRFDAADIIIRIPAVDGPQLRARPQSAWLYLRPGPATSTVA